MTELELSNGRHVVLNAYDMAIILKDVKVALSSSLSSPLLPPLLPPLLLSLLPLPLFSTLTVNEYGKRIEQDLVVADLAVGLQD